MLIPFTFYILHCTFISCVRMTSYDKPLDQTNWRCCWRKQSSGFTLYCPDIAWRQLGVKPGITWKCSERKQKEDNAWYFPDIAWRQLSWKVGLPGNVLEGNSRKKMVELSWYCLGRTDL